MQEVCCVTRVTHMHEFPSLQHIDSDVALSCEISGLGCLLLGNKWVDNYSHSITVSLNILTTEATEIYFIACVFLCFFILQFSKLVVYYCRLKANT